MAETNIKVLDQVIKFMEDNGLRMTSQRRAIIQAAFDTSDHYTAEDLLDRARALDRSVSRATIYRTLSVLVKTGFLRELDFGKDMKFYDPNYARHPNHNHIICKDCERIVEFEDYCLDVRESVITKNLGFRTDSVTLRIEGSCEELAATGQCAKRKKGAEPAKVDSIPT